jgi:hypothetical protein
MPPLPFNFVLPEKLRGRVQLALAVLPIGLMSPPLCRCGRSLGGWPGRWEFLMELP